MIRDFTTGKTKFVQMIITAPDGRFQGEPIKGGLDKRTALFDAKTKYPEEMTIDILDNQESLEDEIGDFTSATPTFAEPKEFNKDLTKKDVEVRE